VRETKFRDCPRCSPATAAAHPWLSADRAHLHVAQSNGRKFAGLRRTSTQAGAGIFKIARNRETFPDRGSFHNIKTDNSKWRPPVINETQHDRKRTEFQPERRVVADFDRAVEDVAQGVRRFRTIDRINPYDNQIAVRHLRKQRTESRVSSETAVPIWLAVN